LQSADVRGDLSRKEKECEQFKVESAAARGALSKKEKECKELETKVISLEKIKGELTSQQKADKETIQSLTKLNETRNTQIKADSESIDTLEKRVKWLLESKKKSECTATEIQKELDSTKKKIRDWEGVVELVTPKWEAVKPRKYWWGSTTFKEKVETVFNHFDKETKAQTVSISEKDSEIQKLKVTNSQIEFKLQQVQQMSTKLET
jgi:chromosome segregation ATPase